jgi:hypothetical protein
VNATALAARLDLDLDATGICLACLSFVSLPLDSGDERKARAEAARIAPDLWAEGLAAPLEAALERARRDGDPDAGDALREIDLAGPRARVVEAVVHRLAQELSERTRRARERNEPILPVLGFTPWREDGYTKGSDAR